MKSSLPATMTCLPCTPNELARTPQSQRSPQLCPLCTQWYASLLLEESAVHY